jgi:chitin disaccharide deacetylase
MPRRLIVNADDFARAPGVSRGILQAHERGIVTSTSVMVNQPKLEEQLLLTKAHPRLGLGLHLVFTAWRPVRPPAELEGLVDSQGRFLDQHTLWARAEQVPLGSLRRELEAQVERFAALSGRLPDHLDCHHFVHLYPPFFQVYCELAAYHRLPVRVPFPPSTDFASAIRTLPFLVGFPRDRVRGMIVTDSALVRSYRLAHPDHFVGTFFGRKAVDVASLLRRLEALPEGLCELMCHPGYDDPGLAGSSYRAEREMELATLTDPAVAAAIRDLGIELARFDALAPCG